MPVQCSTVTLTSSITVADGIFAPGHLGELTQQLPFELVDDVLERAGGAQHRLRLLPSRVGVYFVLALALFPQLGYVRVWDKLTAGLRGILHRRPSEKALREVRREAGRRAASVAVRNAGRPCGTADHTRGAIPVLAHGRLRRVQLHQGP
ncbi:hypothetical protein SM007_39550 [Streptomyces avermitilis]|nr:hypothetical protein SM007_39550 [Streptomyces avermitilis]